MGPHAGRAEAAEVLLYWLPLGAGGHSVRWNGRVFEWCAARLEHRDVCDLYHSALEVTLGFDRFVIEMAPAWSGPPVDRGVVREGPVGSRRIGRLRAFRYEVRRWQDGAIPDRAEAVASPQQVGSDPVRAQHLLTLVPSVPALTWGRDELGTGDMWNSNSLISWVLSASRHELGTVTMPVRGRAPGWSAGLALARRQRSGPRRSVEH